MKTSLPGSFISLPPSSGNEGLVGRRLSSTRDAYHPGMSTYKQYIIPELVLHFYTLQIQIDLPRAPFREKHSHTSKSAPEQAFSISNTTPRLLDLPGKHEREIQTLGHKCDLIHWTTSVFLCSVGTKVKKHRFVWWTESS